jgi:hypothetical protein
MNIGLIKLRGVIRELSGIRKELERMADCWEAELAERGYHMRPPKADQSGPEPTVTYVDEEMDALREQVDRLRREDEELAKESE